MKRWAWSSRACILFNIYRRTYESINHYCQTRWHRWSGFFRHMQRCRRTIEAEHPTCPCAWRFSRSQFAGRGLGRAAEIYYIAIGIHLALHGSQNVGNLRNGGQRKDQYIVSRAIADAGNQLLGLERFGWKVDASRS